MPKLRELTVDERAHIINLHNEGKSTREIAQVFGRPIRTIQNCIKQVKERGRLESEARTGRSRKTSTRTDSLIIREVKKNPFLSARELKEMLNLPIELSTIRQRINEAGLCGRIARRKPFINDANRKKRLAFAREHAHKPPEFWQSILWSDESKFELTGSKRRSYVWRRECTALEKHHLIGTVKHGGGNVMVWGCFSYNGTGNLAIIEGIMTAAVYIDILEKNLPESVIKIGLDGGFIFQQDNDPKHSAKKTKSFFARNLIKVLDWPSQSPDLNPIEHLWDHLDRAIRKSDRFSRSTLGACLMDEWAKIPLDVLRKLIDSIPRRLLAVIKAKGGHTKY